MPNVKLDDSYHLNQLGVKKMFDVSAVVSAFNFTEKPRFTPRWEKYNFSQLLLVLEGEGTFTTRDAEYAISPGKMFYRPAYKSSIYKWNTSNVHLALISFVCPCDAMKVFEGEPITLYEEEQSALLDVIKTGTRICEPLQPNLSFRGMRFKENVPNIVLEFISASLERFLSMVYCRLCGIDLLCDESQKVKMYIETSDLIQAVKDYLTANITESLTLHDICAHFGICQSALTKKFRRECGESVMSYFTAAKIEEAKYRIRKTGESFGEIAEKLKFSTPNYFSKVFKKYTGMTPTEYSKYASKRRIIINA